MSRFRVENARFRILKGGKIGLSLSIALLGTVVFSPINLYSANYFTSVQANQSTTQGTGTGSLVGANLTSAKFCQITREVKGSDVYSDGTNKTVTSSTKTYEDEILQCTGANYDVCPIVAGETIKYNCGQISNFAEVTSALSAVEEATNDFTCSTN